MRRLFLRSIILLLWWSLAYNAFSQSWGTKHDWFSINNKNEIDTEEFFALIEAIKVKDQDQRDVLIQHFQSRYGENSKTLMLQAMNAYLSNKRINGKDWRSLWWEAEERASRSNVEEVLYQGYFYFGSVCNELNILDTSAFYLVKSVELAKKLQYSGRNLYAPLLLASHALFKTHNYKECIAYCKEALQFKELMRPLDGIAAFNNLGLSYQKTGQLDLASTYFQMTADFAKEKGAMAWWAISIGNLGDVLYLQGKEEEAVSYWQIDADTCRKYGEPNNALLSDTYIKRYLFNQKSDPAYVRQIRNSYEKLHGYSLETDVALTGLLSDYYRQINEQDSSLYFNILNKKMADSLTNIVSRNNYNYLLLKYEYEAKENENILLKERRKSEVQRRNFLLLLLVAVLAISGLLYNRQRLKLKFAKQQKVLAEAEASAAKNELRRFTNVLLEKNKQIDSLNRTISDQQESNQDELAHQTLLTDEDWYRFKDLFEKSYPDFFSNLRDVAQDITAAELRLAALIRLGLDNKQMASMQGVSVGAIRTTKTRLRTKLSTSLSEDLTSFIKNLE